MAELVGGATGLGFVAAKAVLMFAVTVVGLRLGERRTLAQLGAFDFAVAVAVGAIIGRTATSSSTSFATGAVALVTLLLAHRLVSALRCRGRLRTVVDQRVRVLIAEGQMCHAALTQAGLTPDDVYGLLRENGVSHVGDVRFLLYERSGAVSLLRRGEAVGPVMRVGLEAAGFAQNFDEPEAA